jgi:cobalt transporter subunit CbtA
MPLSAQQSFRHIVLSAVIAGLITGVLLTLVQLFTTVPLIAQAEVYEQGAVATASHDHGASTWEPKDGFERTFYTGVTTVLTAIGYAFLLGAVFSQLRAVGWKTGLGLGIAGFLVFQLAPALGLPPEPPGSPYADLFARQVWWAGTAVGTALALGAWWFARSHSKAIWIPVGIVLILLPHIIGAPQPVPGQTTIVPHDLSQQFALMALFTASVFWLVLGSVQGFVFSKLGRRELIQ